MNFHNDKQFEEQIPSLENQLKRTFQPKAPNPEFIARLKNQLVKREQIHVEHDTTRTGLLIIGLGFLYGVALLILGKVAGEFIARGIHEEAGAAAK